MLIGEITTTVVSVPARYPIRSAVRVADRVINVLVEVQTDEGPSGIAYVAGFTPGKATAVVAMVGELAEGLRGADATRVGAAWDRMWTLTTLSGHNGIAMFALSAIDIALWDLQGKLLGVPLHRLLGTRRTTLPAYASDGCWLHDDPAAVAAEAAGFADQGFDTIKLRFGRRNPEDDIATLAETRRVVGERVGLMVDVNQGWGRERARAYGRRLTDWNVTWLEEPLAAEDVAGLAALRGELATPITAGENAYGLDGLRTLLDLGAVATLMPDIQRIGGVTGWIAASALAEAYRVPITSHLFPEVSVHLLAASRFPGPLEFVTWAVPLLEEPLTVTDGCVTVPDRPGLGIAFDREAVARYRLA
ncbi:MAG TPA: mandelate racemase/muconate lactonizing enzyme family protein [Thermomicrobiales bacterium]|jgi:L-alanine-DL-glutamate epimerase-like enolase superfamily enzyme